MFENKPTPTVDYSKVILYEYTCPHCYTVNWLDELPSKDRFYSCKWCYKNTKIEKKKK